MSVLIFILVLVALIVVHEFGHFIAAKLSGMRVDEFGLGFPPRAALITKKGETEYTLNWLPFGGFVKIFGEDPSREGQGPPDPRAFGARPRVLQLIVLLAGITMNLVFAYLLITGALLAGIPRALSDADLPHASSITLGVALTLPGSPASAAGLAPGDLLISATDVGGSWEAATAPKGFTDFIAASGGEPIALLVDHNGKTEAKTVTAAKGVVTADPERYALGVEVGPVGVVRTGLVEAFTLGATLTWGATVLTAEGLWHFFYGVATAHADLSQVAGPIGIASYVGTATALGLGNLLALVASISISLALINLLPVPALDGGRFAIVIIEGVIRRPLNPKALQTATNVSFVLLLILVAVVSLHDVYRIAT